jgi:hypothetical protein
VETTRTHRHPGRSADAVHRLRSQADLVSGLPAQDLAQANAEPDLAPRAGARHRPLGLLHQVIQIVMNWDGDHLHAFFVGNEHYGDPCNSPDLDDEERLRLGDAFPPSVKTITFLYDFGAGWYYDITCEKVLDLDVFDNDKINSRLAELARCILGLRYQDTYPA